MSQQRDGRSTIERAYEIAVCEEIRSLDDLRRRLDEEGYSLNMLTGPSLMKDLRGRISSPAKHSTSSSYSLRSAH